ncbi:MAG: hypothetical protein HY517_01845 [Candidatus Aenigmarchaeota archaeon]|nr:hypothetical protein [Candidatus Aenigmarchaeota archaeon]
MKYLATYESSRYRGVYGSSDPWETTYSAITFDAKSDEEAPDVARKSIPQKSLLMRVFLIDHEVPIK